MRSKARKGRPHPFPLKDVLARHGWSQRRLSLASGIAIQTINDIACHRTLPGWRTILRIATTIGADLGDFTPSPAAPPANGKARPGKAAVA